MEAVAAVTDEKVKTAEELITDKGYHSKQAVGAMFRAWDCVVTSVNRIGAASTGTISTPSGTRCMPIDGYSWRSRGYP